MLLTSVIKALVAGPRRNASGTAPAGSTHEAVAACESGDLNRGLALMRGILSRHPEDGEAQYLAGVWHARAGRNEDASQYLERSAALLPNNADVQLALGNVYKAAGDRVRAESCYRNVIELAPDAPAGHYSLGLLLKLAGEPVAALAHLERACGLSPCIEQAWRERVLVLIALERYADAIVVAKSAVERDSRSSEFRALLGYAYLKAHDPRAALGCYEHARALRVSHDDYWFELGMVHQELGRMDEAVTAYEQAIAAKPGHVLARFHLALARLALRDYARAWDDYDLRLVSGESSLRIHPDRAWRGEPLDGRCVLVMGEQGLGDEIMFASCFNEVIESATRCVVTCTARLEKLFRRSFPKAEVVGLGAGATATVRGVDYEIAAGSLPRYLRRSRSDFPAHSGYLRPDPERVAHWKARLATLGPGLKIGISWRGGTFSTRAPLRSLPLLEWRPIFDVPGVHFVSLQYGDVRDDLRAAPIEISHWQEAIDDYDETAALVCALDLVVSVCTAVIHLSGALGRPVWVMAPVSPEWRYGMSGDMPWYPSARLFRQRSFGEWGTVADQVGSALRSMHTGAGAHAVITSHPTGRTTGRVS